MQILMTNLSFTYEPTNLVAYIIDIPVPKFIVYIWVQVDFDDWCIWGPIKTSKNFSQGRQKDEHFL